MPPQAAQTLISHKTQDKSTHKAVIEAEPPVKKSLSAPTKSAELITVAIFGTIAHLTLPHQICIFVWYAFPPAGLQPLLHNDGSGSHVHNVTLMTRSGCGCGYGYGYSCDRKQFTPNNWKNIKKQQAKKQKTNKNKNTYRNQIMDAPNQCTSQNLLHKYCYHQQQRLIRQQQ